MARRRRVEEEVTDLANESTDDSEEEEEDIDDEPEEEEEIVLTGSPAEQAHLTFCKEKLEAGFHVPAFHGLGSPIACEMCEPRLVSWEKLEK